MEFLLQNGNLKHKIEQLVVKRKMPEKSSILPIILTKYTYHL